MTDKRLAGLMIVAALVFSAVDFAYFYNRLPPQVASHFNFQGNPDGWTSKQAFVGLAVAVILMIGGTFASIALFIRHVPLSLMSLPNKAYWTATERVQETREYIGLWCLWFGAATLWQLALVFHKAFVANLRQPVQLQGVWELMFIYLAVAVYLLIRMFLRFRMPVNTHSAA
jgi:uncharacterized membrane protein